MKKVVELIQGMNYERIDIHANAPFVADNLYYRFTISKLYKTAKIRDDKSNMNKILSFGKSAAISCVTSDNLHDDGLYEKFKWYLSTKMFSPEETELLLKDFDISDIQAQVAINDFFVILDKFKDSLPYLNINDVMPRLDRVVFCYLIH